MLAKLSLIFHTVIHLKPIQIYYQLYYKLRNKVIRPQKYATLKGYMPGGQIPMLNQMAFDYLPDATNIAFKENGSVAFTFLNVTQSFNHDYIDWCFEEKGKLWNYNLNYFDFLFSQKLTSEQGQKLITDYVKNFDQIDGGNEPYPISLRGINWIKFFSQHRLKNEEFDKVLYRQYRILLANIEYHILANHLIENGFSLLYAAYYFQQEEFYSKAKELLIRQLDEQILADGAHFERSPMYHQIILFRILDCINLIKSNIWKSDEMLNLFISKAELMLGWLEQITFSNGDIPMVKDAAFGIAPDTAWLVKYAATLQIFSSLEKSGLKESNYRKFQLRNMELLVDIGQVAPSYQPGHAHADECNFILYNQGLPLIVDTGVSTYEKNAIRQKERGTSAHNCIVVSNKNSSQVWGGFRVAKRAIVNVLTDNEESVVLGHNGYAHIGVSVQRAFDFEKDRITITDTIVGKSKDMTGDLYLHFHPDISPQIDGSTISLGNATINTIGYTELVEESYKFAAGFNKLREGSLIRLQLKSKGKLIIKNAD